jgi:hypothetical protein
MPIRSQFITKQNFTGRKKIKQKPELFSISLLNRDPEEARIEVRWSEDEIVQQSQIDVEVARQMVLDVMFLGNTERFELQTGRTVDQFTILECPDDAQLDFRLKVVSSDPGSNGLLLAASASIYLTAGSGAQEAGTEKSGFFDLTKSDSLAGRIWAVKWPEPDNPTIYVDRTYISKFGEKPVFSAHVFPEIIRTIVTGILLRVDELDDVSEGSAADDWLKFVEQRLNFPLRGEEAPDLDTPTAKLNAVDRVIEIFASKPWRSGKTLLEEFV